MPQCQFLFSVVFGFRKVVLEIFSELDATKPEVPIFPTRTRSLKGSRRGAAGRPHHMAAWPPLGCTAIGCGPPGCPPTSPFLLFKAFLEKTLNTRTSIHEKFRSRRHHQAYFGRVLKLFPAPCRRLESSPNASLSPCLPPE